MRHATPLDLFQLLLLAAIYGSAFTAIKLAVPHTGPFVLILARVLIGFAVLLPYALWRGWTWPRSARTWSLIAALCAFNLLLPFFLVSWAQLQLNASLMALLMGAGPFFALIVSHFATGDDRMTRAKLAAVLLGFLGVAIVLGADALHELSAGGSTVRLAQGAALLASLSYAVSGLLVRKADDVPPSQLATLVLGASGACLLALCPLLLPGGLAGLADLASELPRDAILALVYLGLLPTGLAYIMRYKLIRAVGMSFFGLSLYFVPVFGVVIAALWLRETVPLMLFAGLACMLLGLGVARSSRSKARRADKKAGAAPS